MRWFAAFALACAGLYGLYVWKYPTYKLRYRIAIAVEVDGHVHQASSVIEGRISKQIQFLTSVNPLGYSERGDAIFLDLGKSRNLVALLATGEFAERPGFIHIVLSHFKLNLWDDRQLAQVPNLRGKWRLDGNDRPTLVTFSDPADRATARTVKPNEFDQVFGKNVRWRGATVEVTTDSISWGIESHLPWVPQLTSGLSGASTLTHPGKFTLNGTYFRNKWNW